MESNTESHNQTQWRVVEPSLLIDRYKISIFKIQGSLQKRKQKNYKRQKMGVCCEIISPNKQRIQAHKVWPVKCKLKKGDNNVSAKLHRKKSPWDLNPTLTHTHTKKIHNWESWTKRGGLFQRRACKMFVHFQMVSPGNRQVALNWLNRFYIRICVYIQIHIFVILILDNKALNLKGSRGRPM